MEYSNKFLEEEIEEIIKYEFHESKMYSWLQQNSPELFIILVRQIIPKRREQLECIRDLRLRQQDLKQLENELKESEISFEKCKAELRFWEREEPVKFSISFLRIHLKLNLWILINNAFDWILKAGLIVVPLLSLLTIFGVNITSGADFESPILIMFSFFAATSLTWLTSAAIFNLLLSDESQETSKSLFFLRKNFLIFFLIWLSESVIGISTIPYLIGSSRLAADSAPSLDATWKNYVQPIEYVEIFLGIGVFALINILFAIAKGRLYRFNTPKKIAFGASLAKRNKIKELHDKLVREIEVLESKIAELSQEIVNPTCDAENYFNRGITDLAILAMQGKARLPIEP